MATGEHGHLLVSAQGPVVEEPGFSPDAVTLHLQPKVENIAREIVQDDGLAAITNVSFFIIHDDMTWRLDFLQVQFLVPGQAGGPGPSVPGAVMEEQRPDGDSVTVLPRPTVVKIAMVFPLRIKGVTLTNVLSQVKMVRFIGVA